MEDPEKEIRFIKDSIRLLKDDVETTLLSRGWAVTDLDVADEEPLEWFWPPTAPVGYGGTREWGDTVPADLRERRPGMYPPRQTPWTAPTRLTKEGEHWRLDYGAAIAQQPDESKRYSSEAELIADLERIEWWPMSVEEARRIRCERVFEVISAAAWDQHYQAVFPTEPYLSRVESVGEPGGRFPEQGSRSAQRQLIDADAWVSAVRTARVGGENWGTGRPEKQ